MEAAISRIGAAATPLNPLTPDEILAAALIECADELLKLDGYERKARSRRKKAFRALWE